MSASIFISYSRQDEKQAMHLLNLLRHQGYTVWIDQESIAGASIWSDEIVHNIKQSEIFIALISESSAASHNVSKEIAIAAENGKIILPIEIGTVTLPGRLEYALAGIQRTNYHDEQAILHAVKNQVAKLAGETSENTSLATPKARKRLLRNKILIASCAVILIGAASVFLFKNSSEKEVLHNTVLVLPFATVNLDQDSTHNLDIFSEGILTRLSGYNLLVSSGIGSSSPFRESRLNALAIARELKNRYVVEGMVRKYHDVDFVSVRIFDLLKGGEIWEQFYNGSNKELFTIREQVSGDVYGFLRGSSEEETNIHKAEEYLAAHPNDASAYAQLAKRLIASDNIRALDLYRKAINIDSTEVGYYLNAGITAVRQKDESSAREFGKAASRIALGKLHDHPDSVELMTGYLIALDLAGQNAISGRLYDSLLLLRPKDIRLNYNAACCFAKQGNADRTIEILENLFPIAPGKKSEVRSDPDFDNIRMYPRFIKLLNGSTR